MSLASCTGLHSLHAHALSQQQGGPQIFWIPQLLVLTPASDTVQARSSGLIHLGRPLRAHFPTRRPLSTRGYALGWLMPGSRANAHVLRLSA